MSSILDGIINGIFGPDTSQMSEEDRAKTEKARAKDRNEAADLAFSASQNPGEQFMRPETSVGLGASIEDIIKALFGGGGSS